ncbi:MAG: hypothetical protein V3G42_13095 [Oscillospiraceae bacterium]
MQTNHKSTQKSTIAVEGLKRLVERRSQKGYSFTIKRLKRAYRAFWCVLEGYLQFGFSYCFTEQVVGMFTRCFLKMQTNHKSTQKSTIAVEGLKRLVERRSQKGYSFAIKRLRTPYKAFWCVLEGYLQFNLRYCFTEQAVGIHKRLFEAADEL